MENGIIATEHDHLFAVNQIINQQANVTATGQRVMRTIKDNLIGNGSFTDKNGVAAQYINHWTVVGSSNSAAAGLDGVDRWTADANLVWAAGAGAHSWIVLRNAAHPCQLLIDLNSATISIARIVVSFSAGFTGGSTTARPTATDEAVVDSLGAWGLGATNIGHALHVMCSADGHLTRVMLARNGWVQSLWSIDIPRDTAEGWDNPIVASVSAATAAAPTATFLSYTPGSSRPPFAGANCDAYASGTAMTMQYIVEGGNTTTRLGSVTQLSGTNGVTQAWPLFPIGLASYTANAFGRIGRVSDMWSGIAGATQVIDGNWYARTGSSDVEFAQFGVHVFPWNKSVPNCSGTVTPMLVGVPYIAGSPMLSKQFVYLMQASDSGTGLPVTWLAYGRPDRDGIDYPGPNDPINIGVTSKTRSPIT